MKRTSVAALLVLATGLAATAQNRSTTQNSGDTPSRSFVSTPSQPVRAHGRGSSSGQRTFISVPANLNPNVPPQCAGSGISPLIPSAMGCTDPRFTSGFFGGAGAVNTRPRHFHGWGSYAPYYPYAVVADTQPALPDEAEPEPPALTVFERRPTVTLPRPASAATDPHSPSMEQSGAKPEREQVPTILVFRDGHQTEVLNYAIVGQTLYDLGTFVARKIPLSDLNLKATLKANQERGVEISLPASIKVE